MNRQEKIRDHLQAAIDEIMLLQLDLKNNGGGWDPDLRILEKWRVEIGKTEQLVRSTITSGLAEKMYRALLVLELQKLTTEHVE